MPKRRNTTGRNQSVKDHKNHIKKAKSYVSMSLKGMDPKFLRNLKYSKKNNKKQAAPSA